MHVADKYLSQYIYYSTNKCIVITYIIINYHCNYYFLDSHHKLIRWRIVTHGCIDGYSRLVTFLQCSGNNKACTVFELFMIALQQYKLPSRIRTDQGGENVMVAEYMLLKRGSERRSVIVGSSVHNQRIERLWRDVHRCVTVQAFLFHGAN